MAVSSAAQLESQPQVLAALRNASADCGVDFSYLLTTAQRESNLNCNAASKTSSAAGLFQFVKQTWLATLKQHGAEHGYGAYADAIEKDESGRYFVSDPEREGEILALRTDPAASSAMAAELTKETSDILEARLGRAPSRGELYAAHVLGAGGAARLIALAETSPDRPAELAFPEAAAANRGLFADRSGAPVTVAGLYDRLTAAQDSQACRVPVIGAQALPRETPSGTSAEGWKAVATTLASPGASASRPAVPQAAATRSVLGYGTSLKLSPAVLAVLFALEPGKALGPEPRRPS